MLLAQQGKWNTLSLITERYKQLGIIFSSETALILYEIQA